MGVRVNVVSVPGNWEMLYIDGDLAYEGHNVDASDILRRIEGERLDDWSTEWRDIEATQVDTSTYEDLPDG